MQVILLNKVISNNGFRQILKVIAKILNFTGNEEKWKRRYILVGVVIKIKENCVKDGYNKILFHAYNKNWFNAY